MGDAGEGLIDAESRIQERMEELARDRGQARRRDLGDPEQRRAIESLRLARVQLEQQLSATVHERRRTQLVGALDEVNRRMAAIGAPA